MKSLLVLSVIITLSMTAEANRNRNRENRQDGRIAQGVKSGELTRRESRHLMHGQKKIDAFQKKAMADGELSAKEKYRLEKMQDRQSKKIHRQKHDEQSRGPHGNPGQPNQPADPIQQPSAGATTEPASESN